MPAAPDAQPLRLRGDQRPRDTGVGRVVAANGSTAMRHADIVAVRAVIRSPTVNEPVAFSTWMER